MCRLLSFMSGTPMSVAGHSHSKSDESRWTGQDRRVHPRLQISVDIDFQSAHNFYTGKTRDISAGGLFIETDIGLPIGTRINVDLKFLGTRAKVGAEVVWATFDTQGRSVGVGLRFVSLSDKVRQRIEAFMGIRPAIAFGLADAEGADDAPPDQDGQRRNES